jgi:hypothetical protein
MSEIFDGFCRSVCAQVKHATPEEKKDIVRELSDHMADHAQALEDAGYSHDEAEQRAVDAMGDADKIGKELNREYPLLWLLLSRIPVFVSIILVIILVLPFFAQLYCAACNIQARISPESHGVSHNGHISENIIDIRQEVPNTNDIVRFYCADVVKDGDAYYAYISVCCYDKWIFGEVSPQTLYNIKYSDDDIGGGGSSNGGAAYSTRSIPVEYGQESITATYDHFGAYWLVTIPLSWEGVE